MATVHGTPKKLRDGTWGAVINKETLDGTDTMVTITTRAGKAWEAHIVSVVWSGNGVSIVKTRNVRKPAPAVTSHHPRTGCSCGSREGLPKETDCRYCRYDD